MTDITSLFEGHKRFHQKYFVDQPDVYKQLVEKGQSPKTLVVACSDSRVDPAILLDTKPGDLFVIRNVASLIPPYEKDTNSYHGISSALEFAVKFIKVQNVLLIGHSNCAGMEALVNGAPEGTDFITKWVNIAAEALDCTGKEKDTLKCCTENALKVSVRNLLTYPWLEKAVRAGEITLHARYFNLSTGHLETV